MAKLIWLVPALPLAGAAILLLGGRRTNKFGHLLGTLLALASFAVGVGLFFTMLGKHGDARTMHQHLWNWIAVPGTGANKFEANVGFQLDQLSMVFVLLITGVGSLIHIYSIGYMSHDANRRKFFSY